MDMLAFDEINALVETSYQNARDDDITERIKQIVEDFLSFLINAYIAGNDAASVMLGYELTVDVDKMQEAIYAVIDGKTFEDRVAEYVQSGDLSSLQTLADSEYHRVYNAAIEDAGTQFVRERNLNLDKKWHTRLDNRVRDTHAYLEGQSVGLEEEFYTYDGDHSTRPGHFTKAGNNVNCRCWIELVVSGVS